jgi:nitroreductase
MDFLTLASNRYSIRGYDPQKPVEKEKLFRILESGRIAPSAANRQPWTIVVVQSKALLQALTTVYPAKWFADAPVVLIVKGRKNEAWKRRSDNYCAIETDLTIVMDHMILAATAEGLGTCWIAAFDEIKLRQILQLTDDEVVFAITPIGYPIGNEVVTRPKIRKTLEEITEWL